MQNPNYSEIMTTYKDEDREEGKFVELFTDVGNFEFSMTAAELNEQLAKGGKFRNKKLLEFNNAKTITHYAELELDLDKVKVLGIREHTIIEDFKKTRELNAEAEKTAE